MHCNTPNTVMLASFKQLVMLIRSASSRRRASSRPTGPRWRRLRLPVCLCGHCGSDEPRRGGGGKEVASNCPGLLGRRIRVDQYSAQPSPGLQGYLRKTCWPLNCFTKGRVCVTIGRNVGSAAFGGITPDTKVQ